MVPFCLPFWGSEHHFSSSIHPSIFFIFSFYDRSVFGYGLFALTGALATLWPACACEEHSPTVCFKLHIVSFPLYYKKTTPTSFWGGGRCFYIRFEVRKRIHWVNKSFRVFSLKVFICLFPEGATLRVLYLHEWKVAKWMLCLSR